jgi:hypothetical protein
MGMFKHLTAAEEEACYQEFKTENEGKTTIADLSASRETSISSGLPISSGNSDIPDANRGGQPLLGHNVGVYPKFVGVPQGAPTSLSYQL